MTFDEKAKLAAQQRTIAFLFDDATVPEPLRQFATHSLDRLADQQLSGRMPF